MKNLFVVMLAIFTLVGCDNLSPRFQPQLKQKIDNQQGQIDEIKSNQNGINNELGNIRQENAVQDSQLDRLQNGLVNSQNNGLQIFSGSGGLFLAMTAFILIFLFAMIHYRHASLVAQNAANIMAKSIVEQEDLELKDNVIKAAMCTNAEKTVQNLVQKHENELQS